AARLPTFHFVAALAVSRPPPRHRHAAATPPPHRRISRGFTFVQGQLPHIDQRAGLFFGQRISIAIQRGNAASLLGTFPEDSDAEEYFDA
ncbi:hypothetical protein B5X24_HaOG213914, partial [Helicoverpa armigera]